MSAEVEPPSPTSASSFRPLSFMQKLKPKQPLPLAFDNQYIRRQHARSSSLSDFVSTILPSQRKERGHTLRAQYQDDGSQVATDLVFGLADAQPHADCLPSSILAVGSAKRPRSFNYAKGTSGRVWPYASGSVLDGDRRSSEDSSSETKACAGEAVVGNKKIGKGIGNRTAKTAGGFRRFFGSKKEEKHGEGTHLHSYTTEPRPKQQQIQMPVLHVEKAPLLDVDVEISKARRMFEGKKAIREKRRSLRDSADFLGVQGANPRTGYWDVSTGTSSSEPSQISEETKKKLDREARDIEEKKRKWEEAQLKHRAELTRVQTLRDQRRKEKNEQKKLEVKMKQRRYGKWRLSENGWSSVAEPELSPIVQSLAGSPIRETSPSDRLFPMPTAHDPTPYTNLGCIEQQDYFGHRRASSLAVSQIRIAPPFSPPLNSTIHRKPVGSPPTSRQLPHSIIPKKSVPNLVHNLPPPFQFLPLPPLPSAITSRNSRLEAETTLSNDPIPSTASVSPQHLSLSQQSQHFLDQTAGPFKARELGIEKAIVSSYRSASTSQVVARRPLLPNLKGSSPGSRITSLNDFPPISLKDPIAARIPSHSLPNPLAIWAPAMITEPRQLNPISFTAIPTITTTGYAPPLHHHSARFDDPIELMGPIQKTPLSLQHRSRQAPLRTSSHQSQRQNSMLNFTFQAHPAGIVTSSEHQLTPTKNRTARLCQIPSEEEEAMQLKSTPTSISTSPRGREKEKPASQNAALVAFQKSRYQIAIGRTKDRNGGAQTLPKLTMPVLELRRELNQDFMMFPDGLGDIGDPSRNRPGLSRKTLRDKKDDTFLVWHPSPSAENTNAGKGHFLQLHQNEMLSPVKICHPSPKIAHKHRRGEVIDNGGGASAWEGGRKGGASPMGKAPRPGTRTPRASIGRVILRVMQTIWWFVGPVFESDSDIRRRWEQRRLTWQDIGMFLAAIAFTAGMFMITAVFARIVGMAFQTAKGFLGVFGALIGG